MVSYAEAIILGIIQGITEWLPVSSSGHLVIMQYLLGVGPSVAFDAALHVGSVLVLLVVFWKDLVALLKGVLSGDRASWKFVGLLVLATIPIAIVGIFFREQVEAAFASLFVVACGLLLTSLLLFASHYARPVGKNSWWRSLVIGSAQAVAILPGVSRSGSTIATSLLVGLDRERAARFSFLLAIPAIIGAGILQAPSLAQAESIGAVLVGVFVSFIVGYLTLKWLLKIIMQEKFYLFGWYTLVLSLIVFGVVLF